jgi:hypothetical protein
MADYPIYIPDQCPQALKMNIGDTLTIYFHQTVFLWCTDPTEFSPPLEMDIYRNGDKRVVTALYAETVQYGWVAFVPDSESSLGRAGGDKEAKRESGGAGAAGGSSGHLIQVGQGPPDEIELQRYLESDRDLSKSWPFVAPLIEHLVKRPLPRGIEDFLKALLAAGNEVTSRQK